MLGSCWWLITRRCFLCAACLTAFWPGCAEQRRLWAPRPWQCPAPSHSVCSWAPESHAQYTGERWERCWYHCQNILICFSQASSKLHIVARAPLIGYWRYFAWKPAGWNLSYYDWCSLLDCRCLTQVINLELLHFVLNIRPLWPWHWTPLSSAMLVGAVLVCVVKCGHPAICRFSIGLAHLHWLQQQLNQIGLTSPPAPRDYLGFNSRDYWCHVHIHVTLICLNYSSQPSKLQIHIYQACE